MGWARFDDAYTDHPKVVAVGPLAELLDMRAILFSARYETDGHIPPAQLSRIGVGITALRKRVAALVEVGRWHEPGHACKDCRQIPDGWIVHNYLDYNPSREQKEEERAAARERMRRARDSKPQPSNPQSSPDVRPNKSRSSPEVPRSSGNPGPSPGSYGTQPVRARARGNPQPPVDNGRAPPADAAAALRRVIARHSTSDPRPDALDADPALAAAVDTIGWHNIGRLNLDNPGDRRKLQAAYTAARKAPR